MAEIWGAAIGGAAILGGSIMSKNAAKSAANKSAKAAQASADQLEQNYQRTQTNLSPYITAGNDALTQLNAVNSGNYTGFENSPDYQFARDQGIQALDRSAAARGSLYGGGQSADILKFASGLASQNLNTYANRLTGVAQMGQGAATSLGSIGTGNAAAAGNFNMLGAGAQAQGIYDSANINNNTINQLSGLLGNLSGRSAGSTSPSSFGSSYAQNNAGLLGGSTYTGPGSTATSWSTPNYLKSI